ncbi:helix-turn-helix domain-containing protein [Williamsia sp.]|uniref:TetR/AcrR family transcriptional regulator n=1 Tax=Williamsia sp. TaxID=1872085 RepID=UPI001A2B74D4|nr:helix-turn-helix domain-containing protein [Williamsia sp.]MBJ7288445.1 helix-turn-helix transcriptional regulator [Williamsia sp.]
MPPGPRNERRADALSTERIVAAAVEILDAEGEAGLTFRALAARLSTGAGAIYHHVANKTELLSAATEHVITDVVTDTADDRPAEAIRRISLGVFDAIDAHPWVGTHLSREPWQTAMLRIWEGLGGRLPALGVPEHHRFDAASAIVSYVLGVAGQNAANARRDFGDVTDRSHVLGAVADRWAAMDDDEFPFVRYLSTRLRDHDDREQFLAGVDIFLAGIAAEDDR